MATPAPLRCFGITSFADVTMAMKSKKTIRVQNLPYDITEADLEQQFISIISSKEKLRLPWKAESSSGSFSRPRKIVRTSLAIQNNCKIGTVTFQSEKLSENALKCCPTDWVLDNSFHGITTLFAPQSETETDIDICAVHGLGGNGFDTWLASNNRMWLRDFLPDSEQFKRSRIMTFGYSSHLVDRANLSRAVHWAEYLLTQIGAVRRSSLKQTRPIIFICHSLGGLVVREAMIKLNAYPEKYAGIRIKECGLLFLGTPHSGTIQADWNDFLYRLAAIGGLRSDVLQDLRSFNGFGVQSKEAFGKMAVQPPYYCICETKLAKIGGSYRLVVSQDSAGLNGVTAFPMPDVNHNEMCKFGNKFQAGFDLIVERICRIRDTLLSANRIVVSDTQYEGPGHPPITAERFPLPLGKYHYLGRELLRSDRLIGRRPEYEQLESMTRNILENQTGHNGVVISGIGGIGKTELALNFAYRQRNQMNIFFLNAKDSDSLHESYRTIGYSIGADVLANRYPNQDVYSIWAGLKDQEKVEFCKQWMTEPQNHKYFLIIDDIDVSPQSAIIDAIPQQANSLMFTTRNPILIEALIHENQLKCYHLSITEMGEDEITDFISQAFKAVGDTSERNLRYSLSYVQAISKSSAGHPLVALRTVFYIMTALAEQYGSDAVKRYADSMKDPATSREIRASILKFKPPLQNSIIESFEVSKKRLPRSDWSQAWTLLQIIAFMVLDAGGFQEFIFLKRPWIEQMKDSLTHYEIWSAAHADLREWLFELRQVSFGTREKIGEPMRFHPELIHYLQDQAGHQKRVAIMKDIILLACESIMRIDSDSVSEGRELTLEILRAHVFHCCEISESYAIKLEGMGLPGNKYNWAQSIFLEYKQIYS